jgi:hypothetical protein
VTVRRAVAALRRSREALIAIEGQLDALLVSLRLGAERLEPAAADRLSGAAREAGLALGTLGDAGRVLLPRRQY